jgi:hypothetical protein
MIFINSSGQLKNISEKEGIKIMTNKKAEETVQAAESSPTDWARQLVESLVEAERKWLELASQQNDITFKVIREGIENYRTAPSPTLGEWGKQGIENFLEAQRKWTESFTQQRFNFFQSQNAETTGDAADSVTNAANAATDFAQQQVDVLADARRRWLEFATKQNTQVISGVKKGLGIEEGTPASRYVDWAQQAVDNYVEVQKRWLDLATQLPFQKAGRKGN